MLALALVKRKFVLGCFALLLVAYRRVSRPSIGTDFFPTSDVGILKLHVRAPRGMRLEETEKIVAQVEESIREVIPAEGAAHHQLDHRRCRSRSTSPSCRATTSAAWTPRC